MLLGDSSTTIDPADVIPTGELEGAELREFLEDTECIPHVYHILKEGTDDKRLGLAFLHHIVRRQIPIHFVRNDSELRPIQCSRTRITKAQSREAMYNETKWINTDMQLVGPDVACKWNAKDNERKSSLLFSGHFEANEDSLVAEWVDHTDDAPIIARWNLRNEKPNICFVCISSGRYFFTHEMKWHSVKWVTRCKEDPRNDFPVEEAIEAAYERCAARPRGSTARTRYSSCMVVSSMMHGCLVQRGPAPLIQRPPAMPPPKRPAPKTPASSVSTAEADSSDMEEYF